MMRAAGPPARYTFFRMKCRAASGRGGNGLLPWTTQPALPLIDDAIGEEVDRPDIDAAQTKKVLDAAVRRKGTSSRLGWFRHREPRSVPCAHLGLASPGHVFLCGARLPGLNQAESDLH